MCMRERGWEDREAALERGSGIDVGSLERSTTSEKNRLEADRFRTSMLPSPFIASGWLRRCSSEGAQSGEETEAAGEGTAPAAKLQLKREMD